MSYTWSLWTTAQIFERESWFCFTPRLFLFVPVDMFCHGGFPFRPNQSWSATVSSVYWLWMSVQLNIPWLALFSPTNKPIRLSTYLRYWNKIQVIHHLTLSFYSRSLNKWSDILRHVASRYYPCHQPTSLKCRMTSTSNDFINVDFFLYNLDFCNLSTLF